MRKWTCLRSSPLTVLRVLYAIVRLSFMSFILQKRSRYSEHFFAVWKSNTGLNIWKSWYSLFSSSCELQTEQPWRKVRIVCLILADLNGGETALGCRGKPSVDWKIWNGLHSLNSFGRWVLHRSYWASYICDFSINFLGKCWRDESQIRRRDRQKSHLSRSVAIPVRFSVFLG